MTPPTTTMSLDELEAKAEAARHELEIALTAEARTSAAVTDARSGLVLQRITRSALLLVQRSLSSHQENVAMAQSAVKTWERLAAAERERLALERARAVAEKATAFRAEAGELRRDTADTIRQVLGMLSNIEAAFASLNQRAPGAMTARARPPSDFQGAWARAVGGLEQLAQVFDEPRRPRAAPDTTTTEED